MRAIANNFEIKHVFASLGGGKKILLASLALSLLLAIGLVLFFPASPNLELSLFFLVFSPPCASLFLQDFLREKRVRQMEQALPSALFQLSSFPSGAPVENLVESLASAGYGPLSEEFAKASAQVKSGFSVNTALDGVARRSGSPLLQRVCALLSLAHETGFVSSTALRQIAEDSLKLSSIARETAASSALQKYSLLAAGAFIIPLVAGLLISSTASLKTGGLGEFGFAAGSSGAAAGLREIIVLANQVYLAIFSLIASAVIAYSESLPKKTVLYAAFLLPCSLLVFALASSLKFS